MSVFSSVLFLFWIEVLLLMSNLVKALEAWSSNFKVSSLKALRGIGVPSSGVVLLESSSIILLAVLSVCWLALSDMVVSSSKAKGGLSSTRLKSDYMPYIFFLY